MTRLTKSEKAELMDRLSEWQRPEAMTEAVDGVMRRLGSSDLFNQGGLGFLRDAWVAGKFAGIRTAEKVRLVRGEWPDFEIAFSGDVERFEVTEADAPDRRRGIEYQNDDGEVEDDPVEDWIERADQAPSWLNHAATKKAAKHYSDKVNLIIYLNMNEFGIRQAEIDACMAPSTEVAKDCFKSVWVLWKDKVYNPWSLGKRPGISG